jgi:hypothetical protein
VGVLSLNDAAREAEKERNAGDATRAVTDEEIAATLGAICSRRASAPVVTSTRATAETPESLSTPSGLRRPTLRKTGREKRTTNKSS